MESFMTTLRHRIIETVIIYIEAELDAQIPSQVFNS